MLACIDLEVLIDEGLVEYEALLELLVSALSVVNRSLHRILLVGLVLGKHRCEVVLVLNRDIHLGTGRRLLIQTAITVFEARG